MDNDFFLSFCELLPILNILIDDILQNLNDPIDRLLKYLKVLNCLAFELFRKLVNTLKIIIFYFAFGNFYEIFK